MSPLSWLLEMVLVVRLIGHDHDESWPIDPFPFQSHPRRCRENDRRGRIPNRRLQEEMDGQQLQHHHYYHQGQRCMLPR
jgi:hypothetical protein